MLATVDIETVLVYDVPALLTTLATLGVAVLGLKSQRRVEPKVHAIDDAVNNTESEQSIRENVQDLVDGTKP